MMRLRRLGQTELHLSPIGFGAFKIGRNEGIKYPQGYDLPSETEVRALLDAACALGIRYLDTAPAYGQSESRLGAWRAAAPAETRAALILSTKVGETFADGRSSYDFSRAATVASLERSRQRLGVTALDLVFVHAHADDLAIHDQTEVVATLQAERAAGRIRAIGWSGKTSESARRALDWADALMIEYHLEDRSHAAVMTEAAARGVGVIVKKPLAAGRLPAEAALRFALNHPAVVSVVVGSLRAAHLADAVRIASTIE